MAHSVQQVIQKSESPDEQQQDQAVNEAQHVVTFLSPGAEQLDTVFAAVIQFSARPRRRNPELGRRRIVHEQEAAVLVLNGHAIGEHSAYIPQNTEVVLSDEFVLAGCRGLQVMLGTVLHVRRTCQGLL